MALEPQSVKTLTAVGDRSETRRARSNEGRLADVHQM